MVCAALVAGPIAALRFLGRIRWSWLMMGVGGYLLGFVAKIPAGLVIEAEGPGAGRPVVQAIFMGSASAAAELGVAGLVLAAGMRGRGALPWASVLAFGVGAGVFELLMMLPLGLAQIYDETGSLPSVAGFTDMVGWTFLLERGLTLVGHSASRTLLYTGLHTRAMWALIGCFVLFGLNDGLPTYIGAKGWEWTPRMMSMFYVIAAIITTVEIALICWFERRHSRGPSDAPATARPFADTNSPHADL